MTITNHFNYDQTRRYEHAKEVIEALTDRQRQVVKLAVEGLEEEEIAVRLGISIHTLRNHISTITDKAECVSGQKMTFLRQVIPYVSCFYFVHNI